MKFKLIRQLKDLKDGDKFRKLTGTVTNIVFRKIEVDKDVIFEAKKGTVFTRSEGYEPSKYYSVPDDTEVIVDISFRDMESLMENIEDQYDVDSEEEEED